MENGVPSSLRARERDLSQLQLQHRAGGRARDAARALLLGTAGLKSSLRAREPLAYTPRCDARCDAVLSIPCL